MYLPQLLQPGNGDIWALVSVVNKINTKIPVNVLIFNILARLATLNVMRMFSKMLGVLNTLYFKTICFCQQMADND